MAMSIQMETKQLSEKIDAIAPDKTEVRLLLETSRGGLAHFTLSPHKTSLAIKHKTIEEIWYFLEGEGEMWRKNGANEKVVRVCPGTSLTIPTGVHFQFRNTGNLPLRFVIATMPPWPGMDEAVVVGPHWPVN